MGVWVRRPRSWMTQTGLELCWRVAVGSAIATVEAMRPAKWAANSRNFARASNWPLKLD